MTPRKRSRTAVEIAAVLILVLGGGLWLFRSTIYTRADAPAPLPAAPAPAAPQAPIIPAIPEDQAVVASVVGEVVRLGPSGAATALAVGDKLHESDSLRTGKGARTDLQLGSGSRLTVAESTQLTVREISEKVHRFKLNRGRISADYKPNGERVLRVENEAGDAVAETKGARFSLLSTGQSLAVASAEGAVDLTAQAKTVTVGAGQQAIALAGKPPSAAEAIPASLLLKVADASAAHHQEGLCAEVDGAAPRGAEVLIDGVPAQLVDGKFHQRVPKEKDKRAVLVAVRDASGRETTRTVPCETEASIRDLTMRWRRKKAN